MICCGDVVFFRNPAMDPDAYKLWAAFSFFGLRRSIRNLANFSRFWLACSALFEINVRRLVKRCCGNGRQCGFVSFNLGKR